jgi:hypothetical protein
MELKRLSTQICGSNKMDHLLIMAFLSGVPERDFLTDSTTWTEYSLKNISFSKRTMVHGVNYASPWRPCIYNS